MSVCTQTSVRCDRCGFATEPATYAADLSGWGRVSAIPHREGRAIAGDGGQLDACPICYDELLGWWTAQVKPAVPPPATAPQPRRLTIEDRDRARQLLTDELKRTAAMAGAAIRAKPTLAVQETEIEIAEIAPATAPVAARLLRELAEILAVRLPGARAR